MKEHQSALIRFFEGLRGDDPLRGDDAMLPGVLLDAGSGKDTIAGALRAMGFEVVSLDLYDTPPSSKGFIRADLNERLPFKDAAFDCVLCSESLQYLGNHALVFKEFSRVLKKGGRLVISIPNVLSAASRAYFRRRGYFQAFKPVRTVDAGKGWDDVVYNPVSLVEIYCYGRRFGLKIKKVAASRFKAKNFIYFLRLKADYSIGLAFERDERKRELLKLLSSPAALLGDHLVLLMEKKTGD